MTRPITISAALLLLAVPAGLAAEEASPPLVMVIHGGAGTITRQSMTPELEAEYRAKLSEALEAGHHVLREGGASLDAVETAIRLLEDSPLFNAGKGAVFTAEGKNEMDASIMDGAVLKAGAVAGVTTVRHPISAARAVMERTGHVLLAGPGADRFAAAAGLEIVDPSFFYTERRWQSLQKEKEKAAAAGRAAQRADVAPEAWGLFGTVGALALDGAGRLAAGTSTGGLTNKLPGRVGDSPIIGAGTYADGRCAVSGTGEGEYFIRHVVAYDICARVARGGVSIAQAAETVIHDVLTSAGGEGGVIALDAEGHVAMPFNTEGMYRGYLRQQGAPHVEIYGAAEE